MTLKLWPIKMWRVQEVKIWFNQMAQVDPKLIEVIRVKFGQDTEFDKTGQTAYGALPGYCRNDRNQ